MKKFALAVALLAAGATGSLTSGSFAADMPVAYSKAGPVMVPVVYDWSGFYFGLNIGYGWGKANSGDITFYQPLNTVAGTIAGMGTSTSGIIGGGQFGYNQQWGNFVAGLEGDFSGTDIRGTVIDTVNNYNAVSKMNWLATLRGRFGVAFDRVLFYGTAGGAAADVKATLNDQYSSGTVTTTSDNTYFGWTAGVGAEWAFASDWTARVEYLYVDLGSKLNSFSEPTPGWPLITTSTRISDSIVRFGVNYKFGGPVIAKY